MWKLRPRARLVVPGRHVRLPYPPLLDLLLNVPLWSLLLPLLLFHCWCASNRYMEMCFSACMPCADTEPIPITPHPPPPTGWRTLRRPAHLRAPPLLQRGAGALPPPEASPDPSSGGGPHVPPGEARQRDPRERAGQQGRRRRHRRGGRLGGQGADAGRTGGWVGGCGGAWHDMACRGKGGTMDGTGGEQYSTECRTPYSFYSGDGACLLWADSTDRKDSMERGHQ